MDIRVGANGALARMVAVFIVARPYCAHLITDRRANGMKMLLHNWQPPGLDQLTYRRT